MGNCWGQGIRADGGWSFISQYSAQEPSWDTAETASCHTWCQATKGRQGSTPVGPTAKKTEAIGIKVILFFPQPWWAKDVHFEAQRKCVMVWYKSHFNFFLGHSEQRMLALKHRGVWCFGNALNSVNSQILADIITEAWLQLHDWWATK